MLQKISPALIEKARELQRIYRLIDQLEAFIKRINQAVKKMEDQVKRNLIFSFIHFL